MRRLCKVLSIHVASFPTRQQLGDPEKTEEVWFAESEVSGRRYGVLFAARLNEDVVVDLEDDLGFGNVRFEFGDWGIGWGETESDRER